MSTGLVAALGFGCSDGTAPAARPHGTIKVVTSTTGGDPDDDGYDIVVDGTKHKSVMFDGNAFIDSMTVGSHTVALEGVAGNCGPVASTPVIVAADDTATVSFTVACEATGVKITTVTYGPDYGPFQVTVGSRVGSIAANGTLALTRLSPGSQTVSIGLPAFCKVLDLSPPIIQVANRKIAEMTVRVKCGPSDKVLAFVIDDARGNRSVFVSRIDGTEARELAKGHEPAWSPDGTKIIYTTAECLSYGYYSNDVRCFGGLLLLNPESGVSTPVADGENGRDPAWSPDGRSIVFAKLNATRDQSQLFVRRPDGSVFAIYLDEHIGHPSHPAWSPDGRRIAFECVMETSPGIGRFQICAVNPDGNGFTRLTHEDATDLRPAWSPDGSRIAFSTTKFTKTGDLDPSIAVMASDGGNITRIAVGDSPSWSPDGSRLVFNTLDGLFTANADGTGLARITFGTHRYPAWRPNVDAGPGDWDY